MKINNYKAIFFDMDGVILNSMGFHAEAWQTVLKEYGIHMDLKEVYEHEGQTAEEFLDEIFLKHLNKKCDIDCIALHDQKRDLFKSIASIQPYDGVEDILINLSKNGKKLALVTGTSRNELPKVLPDNIFQLFDITITSDDVINGKPNPEPYLKALNNFNLNKNEAIVVENAPLGIKSAKATGLYCIAIATSLPKEFLHEADLIVENIQELKNIIF